MSQEEQFVQLVWRSLVTLRPLVTVRRTEQQRVEEQAAVGEVEAAQGEEAEVEVSQDSARGMQTKSSTTRDILRCWLARPVWERKMVMEKKRSGSLIPERIIT